MRFCSFLSISVHFCLHLGDSEISSQTSSQISSQISRFPRFLGMDGDLGRAVDGGSGRGCWWLLGHCAASAGTGRRSSAVGCPALPCDVFHVGKIQNQTSSELRHGNSVFLFEV